MTFTCGASRFSFFWCAFFWALSGVAAHSLHAEESASAEVEAVSRRWLLLIVGLPGDDEHRERFTSTCEKIIVSSKSVLGVAPECLRVHVGDEAMQDKLKIHSENISLSTTESISQQLQLLHKEVGANDELWVMLIGHAHLQGESSQFNVQGRDFDQIAFANWTKALQAKQQVYFITTPVSGFWIKPLSGQARVVITATEADLEITGTEMAHALANVLSSESDSQALEDIDNDQAISLLDLYLATNLEIDNSFRAMDRLVTEHGRLEDNGDGRGSELQFSYLPVLDSEGALKTNPKPEPVAKKSLDGYQSRHILLKANVE